MKYINFLSKLAFCLLVTVGLEQIIFTGYAFDFQNYTFIYWVAQGCILIICIGLAAQDWDKIA